MIAVMTHTVLRMNFESLIFWIFVVRRKCAMRMEKTTAHLIRMGYLSSSENKMIDHEFIIMCFDEKIKGRASKFHGNPF